MAESGYGLAGGNGIGEIYQSVPAYAGLRRFTPVSYETMECRLPCRWRGSVNNQYFYHYYQEKIDRLNKIYE